MASSAAKGAGFLSLSRLMPTAPFWASSFEARSVTRPRRAAAPQLQGESKGAAPPLAQREILKSGSRDFSPLERVFCVLFCTSRKARPAAARRIAAGGPHTAPATLRGPAFCLHRRQAKMHSRGDPASPLENPPPGAAPEVPCRYRVGGAQELRHRRSARYRQCGARARQ